MKKRFDLRLEIKMLNFIKKYKKKYKLEDNSQATREIISKQEKFENSSFFGKIKILFIRK